MENILKIVYDKSKGRKILTVNDIENILGLIIEKKKLQEYILNMDVQQIRSNNLASYSNYTKYFTIYSDMLNKMIVEIEKSLIIDDEFEKLMYKNLMILQIILHECEHANQEKILYVDNTLEVFILRLANLISENETLYDYKPNERFAEIKSFEEIIISLKLLEKSFSFLDNLLNIDKIQRQLRGYHYANSEISYPTEIYFSKGGKENLLSSFDWYNDEYSDSLVQVSSKYTLYERYFYGFPVYDTEFASSLKELVDGKSKYFKNKINIIKR